MRVLSFYSPREERLVCHTLARVAALQKVMSTLASGVLIILYEHIGVSKVVGLDLRHDGCDIPFCTYSSAPAAGDAAHVLLRLASCAPFRCL